MKQKDIVCGKKYRLVRMKYLERPELEGEIVTITRIKHRSKKETNFCGFFTGRKVQTNNSYETSIGIRVGATNVESLEE